MDSLSGRMFHQYVDLDVRDDRHADGVGQCAGAATMPCRRWFPMRSEIGADATRELLDAGHRAMAHLTITEPGCARDWPRRWATARRSRELYASAIVYASEATTLSAREAALPSCSPRSGPPRIVCFNDQMAMGVYQAAHGLGLRVPDDLSIVGVDDLEIIAGGA